MKTKNRNDFTYSCKSAFQRLHRNREYNYVTGTVLTPLGIVEVYMQGDDRHKKHIRFDVVKNGKVYCRNYSYTGNQPTMRGLARMAHKYIKEVMKDG